MKKFFLILLSISICIPVLGQGKLIESSADKRPLWIKRDVDRYDVMKVIQESTISLNDARNKAFEELTNFATNAITTYVLRTHVEGADAAQIREKVANSQYIKNISELTSIQTYWEHRLVKKQNVYYYYILYNFNDTEKKKVALEINMEDFQSKLE